MAATLGRAIDSACNQGPDVLVVVDDASEDDTPAVVERYSSRFECVRYIRHPQKTACHITAMRPVYESLKCDHLIGLAADDILLPGLVKAVRQYSEHAVVFTHYSCSHGQRHWEVRHPFATPTVVPPGDMRIRIQTQQPVETGVGSSVRRDVMQWLWDLEWQRMGPHGDSIGYATAAAVFGCVYLPMLGAHIEFNPHGYGQTTAASNPRHWAERALEFMQKADLDIDTMRALIAKRCHGFAQ